MSLDDATFSGGANSFADPAVAVADIDAWAVGVNWYFNRNVKWALDYEHTRFSGGAVAGSDRDDERALFGRLQLAF